MLSSVNGLDWKVRCGQPESTGGAATRYPSRMIDEAAGFERFLSIIPEAATARKSGVCGIHDVSQGGIFGALWEMANGAGVGLEIDLKKLPVRQETIEICEFYDLNPYELSSGGCLLMTTEDGNGLAAALKGKASRRSLSEKQLPETTEYFSMRKSGVFWNRQRQINSIS